MFYFFSKQVRKIRHHRLIDLLFHNQLVWDKSFIVTLNPNFIKSEGKT